VSDDGARRLQTVLEAEVELYGRMRDLLQEEREILFCLDAERLEDSTRRKAELADEGRVLESGRQALVAQLAHELALPAEGLRLATLCDALGPEHAGLRQVHNQLVILLGVVRELLHANRSMAGQSLTEVRASIDALGGLLPETAYGPDGARRQTTGRLLRRSA
jgi:hypothetical protein